MKRNIVLGGLSTFLLSAVSASAAVDTTSAVAEIATADGAVTAVGGAILAIIAVVAGFRLVKRAF